MVTSKKRLPGRCVAPLRLGYRPETDYSSELKADGLKYYQELIGVLRWIVELGRVNISGVATNWPSRSGYPHVCFYKTTSKEEYIIQRVASKY